MTTINLMTKNDARHNNPGRPIDLDVQARRLEEEILTVRKLEGLGELRVAGQIAAAIRRVKRIERHLFGALKAATLLTENS